MDKNKILIKVQLSIWTSESGRQAMMYNEDKSLFWQGQAPQEVVDWMDGSFRKFAWGHLDENNKMIIDEEAPDQDW